MYKSGFFYSVMIVYYWNVLFLENLRLYLNVFYVFLKLFKYLDCMQIDIFQLEFIIRVLNIRNIKFGIYVNIILVYILLKDQV